MSIILQRLENALMSDTGWLSCRVSLQSTMCLPSRSSGTQGSGSGCWTRRWAWRMREGTLTHVTCLGGSKPYRNASKHPGGLKLWQCPLAQKPETTARLVLSAGSLAYRCSETLPLSPCAPDLSVKFQWNLLAGLCPALDNYLKFCPWDWVMGVGTRAALWKPGHS